MIVSRMLGGLTSSMRQGMKPAPTIARRVGGGLEMEGKLSRGAPIRLRYITILPHSSTIS